MHRDGRSLMSVRNHHTNLPALQGVSGATRVHDAAEPVAHLHLLHVEWEFREARARPPSSRHAAFSIFPEPSRNAFPGKMAGPDRCRNRKIRHCPDQAGSRFRQSPSFPRKRESTSITKASGLPLPRE